LFSEVFPFSFLAATILLLPLFQLIYTRSPQLILSGFSFLGKISMCIFLFNGPVKNVCRHWIGLRYANDEATIIEILSKSVLLFIIIVIFSYLMWLVYDKILQLLKQRRIV
jgi:peptidoglycan/LPS O-acetylase OafA/YrhL